MTQKKYWAERGCRKTWPSHVSSLVMNGGCEQQGEYTADHKFSFSSGYSKSLPFLLLLPRKKGVLQRLVVVKGERVGEDMDWKFWISRCKLAFIEWINKVLLYSTGNYIQYHIINCNEK